MKELWVGLTDRERLLVMIAAGVLGVFIIALAVVRPLVIMQSNIRQNLASAEAQYDRIQFLANEYNRLVSESSDGDSGAQNEQPTRILVAVAAREVGVVITRIQPTEKGELTLWVDSVSSVAFFRWLKQLDSQFRLSPSQVSLQKTRDGTLRAQVQFVGAN